MTKVFDTDIKQFSFNKAGAKSIKGLGKGENWPIVYILNSSKYAYVGETISAFSRIEQHLKDARRQPITKVSLIIGDEFNKSATLDIENKLIQYMHADHKFELQNANKGQSVKHNYYQREVYEQTFEELWKKLNKIGLADKPIHEIRNTEVFKYSPFKELTQEQYDCVESILKLTNRALTTNTSLKAMVLGGAGTGKSVLAIYYIKMLMDMINKNTDFSDLEEELGEDSKLFEKLKLAKLLHEKNNLKIAYVVPTPSFKNTVKKIFSATPGLSPKMVISPVDIAKDKYDIVVVDEAHRLKNYEGTQQHGFHKKANKALGIDEKASELSMVMAGDRALTILFYDPLQSIRKSDVEKDEFNELIEDESVALYKLNTQLRVKGGNDYIDFIKKLLFEKPHKYNVDKYIFESVDNPDTLMSIIKQRNKESDGLCRVLAGYAYNYNNNVRKKRVTKIGSDIDVNGDGKYVFDWNPKYNDSTAILNDKMIDKVISVFACQGYDLNYAGVILRPDIYYNKKTKRIEVNIDYVFDKKMIVKDDYEATRKNVLNQYLVLLTRGIEGTYFYAVDKNLNDYIESLLIDNSNKA